MRTLTNDEIKKIELDILISFDKFAKEHNLKYFLGYGTLLGAIRHGGFIPWDDDIDLIMLRDDYDKMINILKQNRYISEKHKALLPLDKNYPYSFIKIEDFNTISNQRNIKPKYQTGLWVDIFPLDYIPNDKKWEVIKKKSSFYVRMAMYSYYFSNSRNMKSILLNIFSSILNFLGLTPHFWVKKLLKLVTYEKSDKVGDYIFGAINNDIYNISCFDKQKFHYFEQHLFPIPYQYHDVLLYYGDYMKIPSKEKQKSHDLEAYIK